MKKLDLEEIFVSALGTKQRLNWYLVHRINVISYMEVKNTSLISLMDWTVAFIPKKKRVEVIGGLNSKRLLEILKEKRQDLYKMIMKHPNGRTWLDEQVGLFMKRFL